LDEKLILDEGITPKLQLTEDMGASTLSDGREIMANGWTTSTRTYVTEHCEVEVGYRREEGKYKWLNRPWQRFRYEVAFKEAMIKLGFDRADIDNATKNAYDLREAVKNFAEIYNDRNSKSVDESIGKDLTKYQMRVDYDLERDGDISDKTWELLRKEGLTVVKDRYGYWEVIVKEPIHEDTVKQGSKWVNKGEEGTHGTFRTKKEADAQRKSMFANGYKESKLTEAPIYDLDTRFDPRKSFYSKAKVDVKRDGTQILYSYNTPVCRISADDHRVTLFPRWDESATTLRHVKEFLRQNDFKAESRQQIEKDYDFSDDTSMFECKKSVNEDVIQFKKDGSEYKIVPVGTGMPSKEETARKNQIIEIPDQILYDLSKNIGASDQVLADKLIEYIPDWMDDRKNRVLAVVNWVRRYFSEKRNTFFGYEGDFDVLYNVVFDRLFGAETPSNTPFGIAEGVKTYGVSPDSGSVTKKATYSEDFYVGYYRKGFSDYPRYLGVRLPEKDELNPKSAKFFWYEDDPSDSEEEKEKKKEEVKKNRKFYFNLIEEVARELDLTVESIDNRGAPNENYRRINFAGYQGLSLPEYIEKCEDAIPPELAKKLVNMSTLRPQSKELAGYEAEMKKRKDKSIKI